MIMIMMIIIIIVILLKNDVLTLILWTRHVFLFFKGRVSHNNYYISLALIFYYTILF